MSLALDTPPRMLTFACRRCHRINAWHHSISYANVMFRCERCGTPHTLPSGDDLGPHIVPITEGTREAPRFYASYVPLRHGLYRCFFFELPRPLLLRWNGAWRYGDARVDTRTLIDWQGSWA